MDRNGSNSSRKEPTEHPSSAGSPRSLSDTASTFVPSLLSSIHQRPGYQRVTSAQEEDTSYKGAGGQIEENDVTDGSVHGLRIDFSAPEEPGITFGASVEPSPQPPDSADFLLSPTSARSTKHYRSVSDINSLHDGRTSPSTIYSPYIADAEDASLRRQTRDTFTSIEPLGKSNEPQCRTHRHFHHGRGNWLSVTILILSIYSTVMSAIWLGVALGTPRYGKHIAVGQTISPTNVSTWFAFFAKTIELSFVTVFVSLLGQVLSKRAFVDKSRGITISEMQMRTWVMQPGTMITHWETIRFAGPTLLGAIAFTTAFMAMLYTTASDTLVTPHSKFGRLDSRMLRGQVITPFANEVYIEANCKTPIDKVADPDNSGPTCMAIEHSAQGYHNYNQFLTEWSTTIIGKNGTEDLRSRPPPTGMLFDNTTIQGSWVEVQNMSALSSQYGRTVQNISMALPHAAVAAAGRDQENGILQPQDLGQGGIGEYIIEASVPSPSINVICANMSKDDLAPMIVNEWPIANDPAYKLQNALSYVPGFPSWINKTKVDDIFGVGEKNGRRMPVFPKLPVAYNSVYNVTGFPLTSDSIYLLTASPTSTYTLCSIRASMYPDCSTKYTASMNSGNLSTTCDDTSNNLMYSNSRTDATKGVTSQNWTVVANQWATTMSLNAGISDANASNARLLSQLIPTKPSLDPKLPSIAEALAVMAGCTLVTSSLDSPFIHYWNYTTPMLHPPLPQSFNATVRSQEFQSGAAQPWQKIFYIVLMVVFLINLFCLAYFAHQRGLVTDFIEPQNLFALSLNSPPSHVLDGACGGGPEKEQLKTNWHIKLEHARDHFYIQSLDEPPTPKIRQRRNGNGKKALWEMELDNSPVAEAYNRLSKKPSSLL